MKKILLSLIGFCLIQVLLLMRSLYEKLNVFMLSIINLKVFKLVILGPQVVQAGSREAFL